VGRREGGKGRKGGKEGGGTEEKAYFVRLQVIARALTDGNDLLHPTLACLGGRKGGKGGKEGGVREMKR
jgi:hypothetical protein